MSLRLSFPVFLLCSFCVATSTLAVAGEQPGAYKYAWYRGVDGRIHTVTVWQPSVPVWTRGGATYPSQYQHRAANLVYQQDGGVYYQDGEECEGEECEEDRHIRWLRKCRAATGDSFYYRWPPHNEQSYGYSPTRWRRLNVSETLPDSVAPPSAAPPALPPMPAPPAEPADAGHVLHAPPGQVFIPDLAGPETASDQADP